MPYDKYKKVKAGKKDSGMKCVDGYVDDQYKTANPKEKVNEENTYCGAIIELNDYAENDVKTINPQNFQHLVTGINCDAKEFVRCAYAAEHLYHSQKDEHLHPGQQANEGYHFINSFPGHPDPELVHRAGVELARRLFGEDFYGKVCTHLNTDNYHNHIICSAYSIDGTHKFKDEWHLYRRVRQLSNEVALEFGLDIQMPKGMERSSWSENYHKDHIDDFLSASKHLKEDINESRKDCPDFEEYVRRMTLAGWKVSEKKNMITYAKDGAIINDARLGNRYRKIGIQESIDKYQTSEIRKQISQELHMQMRRENKKVSLGIGRIYIPRYDKNNIRIPSLIRFLMLAKALLAKIGDYFYSPSIAAKMPNNIRTASVAKKMQMIDEAIELCKTYHVSTFSELNELINKTGLDTKAKNVQAMRLYGVAENMNRYAQDLQLYDDLLIVMGALGITADSFPRKAYTEGDVKKVRATLDPADKKLRKQLFNMVENSEYGVAPSDYYLLSRSEVESAIKYLRDGKTEKPSFLISKVEAAARQAKLNCQKRLLKKNSMLAEKYDAEPASEKQLRFLQKELSADLSEDFNWTAITKDKAIRLSSILSNQKPEITIRQPEEPAPSDYLVNSIHDLQLLFPELKEIDPAQLTVSSANNISNYYLAKMDTIEQVLNIKDENTKQPTKKLDYLKYSDLERKLILQFKEVTDICDRLGLKRPEEVHDFIQQAHAIQEEADNLSAASRDAARDYKELKKLERILSQANSISFIYGPLYQGNGAELTENRRALGSDIVDNLSGIKEKLPEIIENIQKQTPVEASLSDEYFSPADYETKAVIQKIRDAFPDYFSKDLNLATLSDYEALRILEDFSKSNLLDMEIQREKIKENIEEQEEKKEQEREENAGKTGYTGR